MRRSIIVVASVAVFFSLVPTPGSANHAQFQPGPQCDQPRDQPHAIPNPYEQFCAPEGLTACASVSAGAGGGVVTLPPGPFAALATAYASAQARNDGDDDGHWQHSAVSVLPLGFLGVGNAACQARADLFKLEETRAAGQASLSFAALIDPTAPDGFLFAQAISSEIEMGTSCAVTARTTFGRLQVAGEELPDPVPGPNTVIPLGAGRLTLNEQSGAYVDRLGRCSASVAAVHLELNDPDRNVVSHVYLGYAHVAVNSTAFGT